MIPLSIILAALNLATAALKAFAGLPRDLRARIVTDILDDKAARDAWWAQVTGWWTAAWAKVIIPPE